MKVFSVLLFILGLLGLVLGLIFWLPARFSPIVAALIGAAGLAAVWGGGRLSLSKTALAVRPAQQLAPSPVPLPTQRSSTATGTLCPRCGSQMVPGQQFCCSCGSSLMSNCDKCGEPIDRPSRFCSNCGAKLG